MSVLIEVIKLFSIRIGVDIMNNDEIRLQFLQRLYDRFYDGNRSEYPNTDEIIQQSGLDSLDSDSVHANVDHLAKSGYIDGVGALGTAYPVSVRLESFGIDFVEGHNEELLNFHNKIRFRILSVLYELNFGGQLGSYIGVDENFINSLELEDVSKDLIFGELVYLQKNGFIKGLSTSGVTYPKNIMIDTYGINVVESILNDSIKSIKESEVETGIKTELKEIENESDRTTKSQKFKSFIQRHETSIAKIVTELIKAWISSGSI